MHQIESRKRQLDAYFARAQQVNDDEQKADLAKFGAVLVCGFVERATEAVVLARLENRAHPRVLRFIKGHFKRGTNYDCEAIKQLLERFDDRWAENFASFWDENVQLGVSLASAYTLRNSIAHGGEANRGLLGVIQLYADAKQIVDGLIHATR